MAIATRPQGADRPGITGAISASSRRMFRSRRDGRSTIRPPESEARQVNGSSLRVRVANPSTSSRISLNESPRAGGSNDRGRPNLRMRRRRRGEPSSRRSIGKERRNGSLDGESRSTASQGPRSRILCSGIFFLQLPCAGMVANPMRACRPRGKTPRRRGGKFRFAMVLAAPTDYSLFLLRQVLVHAKRRAPTRGRRSENRPAPRLRNIPTTLVGDSGAARSPDILREP